MSGVTRTHSSHDLYRHLMQNVLRIFTDIVISSDVRGIKKDIHNSSLCVQQSQQNVILIFFENLWHYEIVFSVGLMS